MSQLRFSILVLFFVGCGLGISSTAAAQSEWISRMDSNRNGYLEPSEIDSRGRRFLERFAGDYGINLSRPVPVRRLEDAARRYFESRSSGSEPDPSKFSNIKGFGPDPELALIPEFGTPIIKYPYTKFDLAQADETLERHDRDRNGYLDPAEIERARLRGQPTEENDLNKDGRLSRQELAQRFARERILEQQAALALSLPTPPTPVTQTAAVTSTASTIRRRSRGADRGSRALAQSIIERYDQNRNGMLDAREMTSAGMEIGKVDYNRDGTVDPNELTEFLFLEMESQGNDLSELLPTWFFERDQNGDKQIEMAEFTDEWTPAAADEFASYDTNGDGIITADEILASKRVVGGTFANHDAKILLPRSVVVSEIQVDEDILIGDLNVQLSITHTFNSQLDAYLIGPDGQRIELFSGVGGSDDHFEKTIFDDQAGTNIAHGRAPFAGSFQPGALAKRQPGLSSFKGKSLKGLWQLMIRSSRSDRAGVLHEWSLLVEPDLDSVDRLQLE